MAVLSPLESVTDTSLNYEAVFYGLAELRRAILDGSGKVQILDGAGKVRGGSGFAVARWREEGGPGTAPFRGLSPRVK